MQTVRFIIGKKNCKNKSFFFVNSKMNVMQETIKLIGLDRSVDEIEAAGDDPLLNEKVTRYLHFQLFSYYVSAIYIWFKFQSAVQCEIIAPNLQL